MGAESIAIEQQGAVSMSRVPGICAWQQLGLMQLVKILAPIMATDDTSLLCRPNSSPHDPPPRTISSVILLHHHLVFTLCLIFLLMHYF